MNLSIFLTIALLVLQAGAGQTVKPVAPEVLDDVFLPNTSRLQNCYAASRTEHIGPFGAPNNAAFFSTDRGFARDEKINWIEIHASNILDNIAFNTNVRTYRFGGFLGQRKIMYLQDDEELLAMRICTSNYDAGPNAVPFQMVGGVLFVTTKGQVLKGGLDNPDWCQYHHVLFQPNERLASVYGYSNTQVNQIGFNKYVGCT